MPMTITLLCLAVAFIILGMPIAVCLGFSSLIVMLLFQPVPLVIVPQLLFSNSTSFIMVAVPLFILVGNLMERGSIGKNLIDFVETIFGSTTGGLGSVNIVGSMMFGGISGSSLADTAVFGSILVPQMEKQGYPKEYAAGVTVISSCLSVIIPPSINIVLAAAIISASVSRSMAAGVIPGILLTLIMLFVNLRISIKNNYGYKTPFNIRNIYSSFKETWTALIAPLIILGGIFSGLVTPTESAALGVLYVLFIDFFLFKKLTLKDIKNALYQTGKLTSSILLIATGSAVANYILAFEKVPFLMSKALSQVPGGQFGFSFLLVIFLILLGAIMDAGPIIIIFTPLFLPVAMSLGMDPVHYLIIIVTCTGVGLTTPPYGVCLFSLSAITGISIQKISRSTIPFYLAVFVGLSMIAFLPKLSLFLPNLLGL